MRGVDLNVVLDASQASNMANTEFGRYLLKVPVDSADKLGKAAVQDRGQFEPPDKHVVAECTSSRFGDIRIAAFTALGNVDYDLVDERAYTLYSDRSILSSASAGIRRGFTGQRHRGIVDDDADSTIVDARVPL